MHDSKFQHRLILWGFLAVVVIVLIVWQGAQLYLIESETELIEQAPLPVSVRHDTVDRLPDWNIPLDLRRCAEGDARSLVHGLGSNSTVLRGKNEVGCIARVTIEVEGGYTTSECVIAGKDAILAEELVGRSDCKIVDQGNVWQRSTE